VLRAHPNPRQAAQTRRETRAAVRNLASIAAGIARAFLNPEYRTVTSGSAAKNKLFCAHTLLDGDQDTGSLAFAYHAHDVISGSELLPSIVLSRFVLVFP
jgi:hypothetical protein